MPNPSPAPPPYYITSAIPPAYCNTCGRVISSRRNTPTAKKQNTPPPKTAPKFCSDRCKRHKPSNFPASAEVHVEKALVALLEGQTPPPPYKSAAGGETSGPPATATATATAPVAGTKKKGESRVLLPLSVLEESVFGPRGDPDRSYGRRRNRAFRGVREDGEWRSVDMEDESDEGDAGRPEPISTWDEAEDFDGEDWDVEGGVRLESKEGEGTGGEAETPELVAKRRAGQKRAEEREFVRCVVRRAVVFGVEVEGWEDVGASEGGGKKSKKGRGKGQDVEVEEVAGSEVKPRRKCEAVMQLQVVEPSFAKGDWCVRWRDE